jgi:Na+/proline symporter
VNVSRAATVLLFGLSLLVTWQLSSVERAWRLLLALGAGTGLVLILRWYWWRTNAWSEISAMIASFLTSFFVLGYFGSWATPAVVAAGGPSADAWVIIITVTVTTVVWLVVTFVTSPEPDEVLAAFYRRVRPGGPGWARVSKQLGYGTEPIPGGALAWTNWIAGIIAVYGTLFGIGKLVFGETVRGLVLLVVALAAFLWIARSFREEEEEMARGAMPVPEAAD